MLSELKIDGNTVTTASSYEFTNVSNSHTITATFSPISYTISYNLDGGTVSGNPTSYTIEDAMTLVNPTKDGYNFTGWTENISTSNWYEGFINYSTGAIETNSTYPNAVYSEPIFIKANTTYTASGTSLGGIRWRGFDSSGNYLGGISNEATCTPTQDCYGQILLIDGCTEANRNAMIITSNAGTSVTIPAGSTGNREYTANWEVAGREFVKTTTLVDGATYIVCSDTNALQNNSGSIANSTVSVVNDKITTADKTIMWTYSGGKLINDATGTTYYLKGTSSALSLVTTASQGTNISYASSSKLKVAEGQGQSSGYPWGGNYGTTFYYLVYNSGFTVNTSGSTITLYAEEGLKLNTPTGTGTSLTEISVSITGNVIPNGDIKYELYVNNSKKSETTQTSGRAITLNATGLSKNTTYSCYIKATSVSDSTITAKSSTISVKTYSCDGTGSTCTSRPSGNQDFCETCNGSGGTLVTTSTLSSSHYACSSGSLRRSKCNSCDWSVEWCNMCGITSFTAVHSSSCSYFCKACDGNMNFGNFYCKHAQTSSHPCCIHGYTKPHN